MKENVRALVDIILGRPEPQKEEFRPIEVELLHVSLGLSSFSQLSKTQLVDTLRDALRSCGQLRQQVSKLERVVASRGREQLFERVNQLSENNDLLVYASVLIGYPCGKGWKQHQYRLKRLLDDLLMKHRVTKSKLEGMVRRMSDYLLTVEYDLGELLQEALDLPDTVSGPSPPEFSLLDLLPSKE